MTDAVARLVDYYRQAADAMQGLPICNPALAVEAVGFRAHDGRHVGVIVTPWFMNLTVLPSAADLTVWRPGQLARLAFPSGLYDFVVSEAGDDGLIATCSLFSPMHDFADHADARAAALAAVDALFERESAPKPVGDSPAPAISRRRFLRGG
ncbi:MAG TPA: [NiFe]-hydrogenase assembly chaperone HybE [Steroidobacteraceae bacterium]|nr:[NiFe]-hydrogenase assembly chaperone HybE [Steroidobacteraceae bacterium]